MQLKKHLTGGSINRSSRLRASDWGGGKLAFVGCLALLVDDLHVFERDGLPAVRADVVDCERRQRGHDIEHSHINTRCLQVEHVLY